MLQEALCTPRKTRPTSLRVTHSQKPALMKVLTADLLQERQHKWGKRLTIHLLKQSMLPIASDQADERAVQGEHYIGAGRSGAEVALTCRARTRTCHCCLQ